MTRPDERRFVLFPRGKVRDEMILASFRNSLRTQTNPDTNALFTEDEILRITQQGSRFYIEADAIDLYGQAVQSRDSFLVDQFIPHRAASTFLQQVHGPLWAPDGMLEAEGGSGAVSAPATAGVIFIGSTTIPDPAAHVARDPNGKRYQVLITTVTPAGGIASLILKGIDGGDDTNLASGTQLTWTNPPVGAEPNATVASAFSGGVEAENDSDFAARIEDIIRHRPASGNQAHFRAWSLQASSSVETSFIYASAFHAGSVLVCATQKRANVLGPYARIPNFATLAALTGYLVPPSSPVVPGNVFVLVVPPQAVPSSVGLRLGLRRGASGGWGDLAPWPRASTLFPRCTVTFLVNSVTFQVTTDEAPNFVLPATGANAPQLMVWDPDRSEFIKMDVASVSFSSTNVYTVTLNTSTPFNGGRVLQLGDTISPYTDRKDVVEEAVQTYFDSLGPGEVVDFATDVRAHRAYRYPRTNEGYPQKVGQGIVTVLLEELGGVATDAELVAATVSTPTLPTNVTDGPKLLTLNHVGVYDFED